MQMKCAVFSCLGLGDGLLSLILSNNLHKNGRSVITFHPFLKQLQPWFPHLSISPFPDVLEEFDHYYIVYEKTPWMQKILRECESKYPEKTSVLNPIATRNRDYPYWSVGQFDGGLCFADNLFNYCKAVLQLPNVEKGNGMVIPSSINLKQHVNRVVIHPMSSRPGKNWPQDKYLTLAKKLEELGFEPVFILTAEEKKEWQNVEAPSFSSLHEAASYICESGYMIGNDSGIGHLASCQGLPTLTICRNKQTAAFWRPGWSRGDIIFPSTLIPNLKGMRLRDKYWKNWISVERVVNAFLELSVLSD